MHKSVHIIVQSIPHLLCLALPVQDACIITHFVQKVVGVCPAHAADEHHLLHSRCLGCVNLHLLAQPVNLMGMGREQQGAAAAAAAVAVAGRLGIALHCSHASCADWPWGEVPYRPKANNCIHNILATLTHACAALCSGHTDTSPAACNVLRNSPTGVRLSKPQQQQQHHHHLLTCSGSSPFFHVKPGMFLRPIRRPAITPISEEYLI
jgi:hypothetical protein